MSLIRRSFVFSICVVTAGVAAGCARRSTAGSKCEHTSDCEAGLFCMNKACVNLGPNGTSDLSITPSIDTVYTGERVTFTVNSTSGPASVSWSADAGRIDSDGHFTAPEAPMSVRITATSRDNPGQSGSLSIQVVEMPPVTGVLATTDQTDRVTVSWQELPRVSAYVVFRGDKPEGPFAALSEVSALSFDDAAEVAKSYYYVVRAKPGTTLGQPSEAARGIRVSGGELCVASPGNDAILIFDPLQNGDEPPLRRLGSLTELARPEAMAIDEENGEIFVVNRASNTLTVYDRATNGNSAPKRVLGLPWLSDDTQPRSLALDVAHNLVLVTNPVPGRVLVYARDAQGSAAPLRTLEVAETPVKIAVDSARRQIVVAAASDALHTQMTLRLYDLDTQGWATPLHATAAIVPPSHPIDANGLFAAPDAVYLFATYQTSAFATYIYKYTRSGDTSLVAPSTPIALNSQGVAVTVDHAKREIFMNMAGVAGADTQVKVYDLDSGAQKNDRTIGSAVAHFKSGPLAYDGQHGELLSAFTNSVVRLNPTVSGDVTPIAVISGRSREFTEPRAIAYDRDRDELLFGGEQEQTIYYGARVPNQSGATPITAMSINDKSDSSIVKFLSYDIVNDATLGAVGQLTMVGDRGNIKNFYRPYFQDHITPVVSNPPAFFGIPKAFTSVPGQRFIMGGVTGICHYDTALNIDCPNLSAIAGLSLPEADGTMGLAVRGSEVFMVNATTTATSNNNILVLTYTANTNAYSLARAFRDTTSPDNAQPKPAGALVYAPLDALYVTNARATSITSYTGTASGDAQPLRTIAGPHTGLADPRQMVVCKTP